MDQVHDAVVPDPSIKAGIQQQHDDSISLRKISRQGGPVTFVQLLIEEESNTCLLWARGPYLYKKKYHHASSYDTNSLLVFPNGGSIHGTANLDCIYQHSTQWDTVVYGGNQLAFCCIQQTNNMSTYQPMQLSDWILSLSCIDRTTMLVGMAHHVIEIWSLPTTTTTATTTTQDLSPTCLRRIHANPSCLLFSMDVYFFPQSSSLTPSSISPVQDILIAAGTAYSDIHIWSLTDLHGNDRTSSDNTTSHRLQGHAGVVHALQFSNDGQSLASASDDRSVRLWSCCSSSKKSNINQDITCTNWKHQWVAWGHLARVWDVAFVVAASDASTTNAWVASVSEDRTTRIWEASTGNALSCIHHSTPLWSIATLDKMAAVGTANGTAIQYDLSRHVYASSSSSSGINKQPYVVLPTIPVPEDRPQSNHDEMLQQPHSRDPNLHNTRRPKPPKTKPQIIVGISWLECSNGRTILLVSTRHGSLFYLELSDRTWHSLHGWWHPSLFQKNQAHSVFQASDGCCMEVVMTEQGKASWAAIGTSRGEIVLVSIFGNPLRRLVLSGRGFKSVQALQWLNPVTLASFHVECVLLWNVTTTELMRGDSEADETQLPIAVLQLRAKGVPLCCCYHSCTNQMVVGDSRGNLSLFQIPSRVWSTSAATSASSSGAPENGVLEPTQILYRVHKKEHVTSVSFQSDRILSVGNDGCWHTSFWNDDTCSWKLGWSVPAPSMTGITNILESTSAASLRQHVLFAGYYGNIFRVIDAQSGYEFLRFDSGGRQRRLELAARFDKSKDVHMLDRCDVVVCNGLPDGSNELVVHQLAMDSSTGSQRTGSHHHEGVLMHGETIFGVSFFVLGDNEQVFLLTGSEDCYSKISICGPTGPYGSLSLTPQSSCVRAVGCSQVDRQSALLVVGGGKLELQFFLVRTSKECPTSLTDLAIYHVGNGGIRQEGVTIDHRINAVKAIPLVDTDRGRTHLVLAGDSNGCCHFFVVPEEEPHCRASILGMSLPASERPILAMDLVPLGSDRILTVLGTTGGDIELFDTPCQVEEMRQELGDRNQWSPFGRYSAHQLGTNTLCAVSRSTGTTTTTTTTMTKEPDQKQQLDIVIFSGGDDQSLCHCLIQVERRKNDNVMDLVRPPEPIRIREASFSAIKGVWFIRRKLQEYLVVAGYSQVISLWEYTHNEYASNESQLEVRSRLPIDVGDVNSLGGQQLLVDHDELTIVAVAGLGVEFFSVF